MVLDAVVQTRWDKPAANRLPRKLLKPQRSPPRVMISDKLASCVATKRGGIRSSTGSMRSNNQAKNSQPPARRRERQMKRFRSAFQAQRLLSSRKRLNALPLWRDRSAASQPARAGRVRTRSGRTSWAAAPRPKLSWPSPPPRTQNNMPTVAGTSLEDRA